MCLDKSPLDNSSLDNSPLDRTMTLDRIDRPGFAPRRHQRSHECSMVAQLITTVALVLSIAVAATAVSIGIAHADGIVATAEDQNAQAAVLLALAFVGIGGVMAFVIRGRTQAKPRQQDFEAKWATVRVKKTSQT
jgi:hypothetical protein